MTAFKASCTNHSPVLQLPGLGVASQQHARRCAVGEEDGHRVVVGLTEQLPWRRYDVDSGSSAPR
jgi:hypothetical protein